MLREFLSSVSLFSLPLLAMGMFLVMFVIVLLRACQRARFPEYDRMATLPLQGDSVSKTRSDER